MSALGVEPALVPPDSLGVGIFAVDRQLRVVRWNRWMERHSGRSPAHALGQELGALFPTLGEAGLRYIGDCLENARTHLLSAALHGSLIPLDGGHGGPMLQDARILPLTAKDGSQLAIVVLEDVTGALHFEKQLRRSELRYRTMIESLQEAVLQIDEHGVVTYVNQPLTRLLGCPEGAATGRSVHDLMDEHSAERVRCPPDGPERPGQQFRAWLQRDGRRSLCVLVRTTPLVDRTGTHRGAIASLVDIEARLAAEQAAIQLAAAEARAEAERARASELAAACEALSRSQQQLEEAQEQLVQSARLAAIGELAASLAHEINNPLSAVILATTFLQDDVARRPDAPAREEHVELARRCAARCKGVVDRLLGFVNRGPGEHVDFDLRDAVRDGLALVEHQLRSASLRSTMRLDEPLPVRGDRGELSQVVVNLLVNAAQASDAGGHVSVVGLRSDSEVLLAVRDDGCGIPSELLERVFEPCFSTKPAGTGTGLGLSLSRRIARDHGGSLQAESELGQGTSMTLTLPCSAPELGQDVAPPPPVAPMQPEKFREGATVLVVDDEQELVLPAVVEGLRRAGLTALSAGDGEEALAVLGRVDVQILLVDLYMPSMCGLELIARAQDVSPTTVPILMSGSLDEQNIMRARHQGVSLFLPKPSNSAEAVDVVQRALQIWRTSAGS